MSGGDIAAEEPDAAAADDGKTDAFALRLLICASLEAKIR
jgi:hypothetical protein